MAGSGAALARANAALATSSNAAASAAKAQTTAGQPRSATIYASAYGVVADGVTDSTAAITAAIAAAATAASTSASAFFCEVVLPAGTIRTTAPIVCNNGLTGVQFRIRGAGKNSTQIYADFYTANAAPQFTVSGGGGTGAILYPVFYFGVLTRVFVAAGGSGYTTAPTATLAATSGSGASVALTVAGGVVTAASVTAGGSGYPTPYAGDALVIIGSNTEVTDLSVVASPARAAASNGGNSAYPYFTTNSGIRFEPADPGYIVTVTQNRLERVSVSGHPGHGIHAARQEQWLISSVISAQNGADGLCLHTDGQFATGAGISNTFLQYRGFFNSARGLHVECMDQSTYIDCCVFQNLQGAGAVGYATLSGGAIQSVALANQGMGIVAGTGAVLSLNGGGGSGATITPVISNGAVTGFTVTNGGSGYSQNQVTGVIPVVTVASAAGLPAGVNEEILFNQCRSLNWFGDVEMNTGEAVGRDVIKMAGTFASKLGGYFRGGRYGVYLSNARGCSIDAMSHYGNPSDYSKISIINDTGSNTPNFVPIIGSYYNLGQVNNPFYSANQFQANGFVNGVLMYCGLQGSGYSETDSASFAPNPIANGCDQYVTLTGNVAIANPASALNGLQMVLTLMQDATGGRAPSWGSQFAGVGSVGSGTANQICVLKFRCVTLNATRGTLWVLEHSSGWS